MRRAAPPTGSRKKSARTAATKSGKSASATASATANKYRTTTGGNPAGGKAKNIIATPKRSVEYVLRIERLGRGKVPVVREVHRCTQERSIDPRSGNGIILRSEAKILMPDEAIKIAKKFHLPYRPPRTSYSLRFSEQLDLLHGFRHRPNRAHELSPARLKKIARRLRRLQESQTNG